MKRNTIGVNPLDAVIPPILKTKPPKPVKETVILKAPQRQSRQQITFQLPLNTIERLRDTAYWLRRSMNDVVQEALSKELSSLGKKENGGIPKRERARLAPGRKVRK
jgi:hypothetical protein